MRGARHTNPFRPTCPTDLFLYNMGARRRQMEKHSKKIKSKYKEIVEVIELQRKKEKHILYTHLYIRRITYI